MISEEEISGLGTEKVSSGASESEASSSGSSGGSRGSTGGGSGGSSGSSSGSSSNSGTSEVDCTCEMYAAWDHNALGDQAADFLMDATGTCDLTVTGYSTDYTGDSTFLGDLPLHISAGQEVHNSYIITDAGTVFGHTITVYFECENGQPGEVIFVIP